MNSKPDKEDRRCDDIAFLSEIIDNFIFWQVNKTPVSKKLGPNLMDIFNMVGFSILLITIG